MLALAIAAAGCSPIETWRSLSGANKNDPDPATAPFAGNLAEAEAAPYPNLASVPPLPSRATSAAERQKLTERLLADRAAAAQAGSAVPAAAQAGSGVTAAAARPATTSAPMPGSAAGVRELPGAPSGSGPVNASLAVPQVRSLPEPDTVRPSPPPPRFAAVPPPAAATALPPAIGSAAPQPAPPPPVLAPIAPPPPIPALAAPARASAATTVAMLDTLDRGQIEKVAARYKERPGEHPGGVRVIGHAAAPPPGADPLAGYHAALERAQAFAKALADAGIPANRIQTEATPTASATQAAQVEIQFLP